MKGEVVAPEVGVKNEGMQAGSNSVITEGFQKLMGRLLATLHLCRTG